MSEFFNESSSSVILQCLVVFYELMFITVKARVKEPSYFGVSLAKILKLRSFNRLFCPNCR